MYSVLPAVVSILFLCYGFYAFASRGVNRISVSFVLLCVTTFFWQASWAVLFQTSDPAIAHFLVKFGYFFILFLPSSMYLFLTEICGRHEERRYVYFSYALALGLAGFLFLTDLFVAGYYQYFWGYYPKAGVLHPLHVLLTTAIALRCFYITYQAMRIAFADKRIQLHLCFTALVFFFIAGIDYLCNYGFEFYPPGVFFIGTALIFFTIAIVNYGLLNPMALAGTIAHEMRTPLSSIRMQAQALTQYWPILLEGYRLAVEHGLMKPGIRPRQLELLSGMSRGITAEVDRSNAVIDMLLASTSMERPETLPFERHKIAASIADALARYPFEDGVKEKVSVSIEDDFEFYGSDTLLVFVLFNLLKNSLYALKAHGKGEIQVAAKISQGRNIVSVTDTGPGIPKEILPHIFDSFYSTKRKGGGAGIGLSFCKKVMTAFKGSIKCESSEGEYTSFILEFPAV
ncbi:MAG TPA: ATP-binding protein [Gallionella sp.]|nr:ATP-binding protein [Gallionella sp.]